MSSLFQTYGRWDIDIKKAKGTYVEDQNGKTYLDFIQGIAVSNLGHCHEAVTEAVKKQLDSVWHVSNLFQNSLQEQAAQKLAAHSAGDLVFFCNSGAEANEGAIKLARKATGKTKIITFLQSFHGRTYAGMAATGQDKIKTGFGPMLGGFHYLPYNDPSAFKALGEEGDIAAVMLKQCREKEESIRRVLNFYQPYSRFARKSKPFSSLMKSRPASDGREKASHMSTSDSHRISSQSPKDWETAFRSALSSEKTAWRSVYPWFSRNDFRRKHAGDGCCECHIANCIPA